MSPLDSNLAATGIKAWLQSCQHWPGAAFVAMIHGLLAHVVQIQFIASVATWIVEYC